MQRHNKLLRYAAHAPRRCWYGGLMAMVDILDAFRLLLIGRAQPRAASSLARHRLLAGTRHTVYLQTFLRSTSRMPDSTGGVHGNQGHLLLCGDLPGEPGGLRGDRRLCYELYACSTAPLGSFQSTQQARWFQPSSTTSTRFNSQLRRVLACSSFLPDLYRGGGGGLGRKVCLGVAGVCAPSSSFPPAVLATRCCPPRAGAGWPRFRTSCTRRFPATVSSRLLAWKAGNVQF